MTVNFEKIPDAAMAAAAKAVNRVAKKHGMTYLTLHPEVITAAVLEAAAPHLPGPQEYSHLAIMRGENAGRVNERRRILSELLGRVTAIDQPGRTEPLRVIVLTPEALRDLVGDV